MSAGMHRVGDPEVSTRPTDDGEVVTVIEPVLISGAGAVGIDVSDPAQSPVGVPVVLVRGSDGILRADAAVLAALASRDDVAQALAGLALAHRHVQALPAQTWLFTYPMPFVPAAVSVVGEVGQRIWPAEVVHTGPGGFGQCRIEFTRPVAGVADLS